MKHSSVETLTTFKQIIDRVTTDVASFLPYLNESVGVSLTDSQLTFLRRYGQPAVDSTKRVLKERLGALGLSLSGWQIDLADPDVGFSFRISRRPEPDETGADDERDD